jgi:hypothetical protein
MANTSVFEGGKTDDATKKLLNEHMTFVNVEGCNFSSLAKRNEVKRISLIQIDTEGYDWKVLSEVERYGVLPLVINVEIKWLFSRTSG